MQCIKSNELQTCTTCEFNFKGVCANHFYGENIEIAYEKAKENNFDCWNCSLEHFNMVNCKGKCR